ncbi:MAG: S-layer family protein [Cyanobacteria bacterium P01_C01_bin.118]
MVTGGHQQVTTLFHSFQEFSPDAADVLFQLDGTQSAVDVVISRVTGTNASLVDGQLQLVGGNAPDLFLLNPNGITFGANASLLLPGSFFASTAEQIVFEDDLVFSVNSLNQSAPLLTVSRPIGLRFGATANSIIVNQSDLEVDVGQSLGFLGGDLQFISSSLNAEAGYLVLGSVAPGSQVGLDPSTLLLDYTNTTDFRDITLTQNTEADVSGDGGGRFQFQGRTLQILENSNVEASNTGPIDGGTVSLRASERIDIVGTGDFGTYIFVNAIDTGQGNQLLIETEQLSIRDAAFVSTDNFGQGASGGLMINANRFSVVGNPDGNAQPTIVRSSSFGPGQGGDLWVTAEQLIVQNSGQIFTDAFGSGAGGNMILNVGKLSLQNGAQVGPATFGEGDSGNLIVTAKEAVEIIGFNTFSAGAFSSGLFATAEPGSTGNAGNISIVTPRLSVLQGGKVAVNTVGAGDGGAITIRAGEIEVADPVVDFTGAVSGLVANVIEDSPGSGGSLDIEADRLRVYNGGQITASTDGVGNAGTVEIRADEIDVSGQSRDGLFRSGIMSGSKTSADAGSVNLTGNQITIRDGAGVSVNSLDGGAAGNLNISAERLFLNDGTLQAKVTGGNEGNLDITATEVIFMRQNSQVVTSATGMATGGNITLTAPVIVGLENSDIVANAVFGSGGSIDITTRGLIGLVFREQLTPESDIVAGSQFGLSGTVQIDNFEIEPASGLVELPTGFVDSSDQITQGCVSAGSRFVATGRGGIPVNPAGIISRDRTWTDTRDLSSFLHNSHTDHTEFSPVLLETRVNEANNWYTNALGQVELVADNASLPSLVRSTCAVSSTHLN